MFARRSHCLSIACLALPALVDARTRTICYDQNDNRIDCPKKPLSKTQIIIIIVVLALVVVGVVGFFLFRVFRRRRIQKYQALPVPSGTVGSQGGVMTPAAQGEMGYAGPQPQLPYNAPSLTYNAPQTPYHAPQYSPNAPTEDTAYTHPGYPPSETAYTPPPGPPPPPQAATHYGYSAGAI